MTIEQKPTKEGIKAVCLHCGNEIWEQKIGTEGSYYYMLRDKFGNVCKDGFWHVPASPSVKL